MSVSLMWFRNDLRISDNPAFVASAQHKEVIPIYIYDESYGEKGGASKVWLHHSLIELGKKFQNKLQVFSGDSMEILSNLCVKYNVTAVYGSEFFDPKNFSEEFNKVKTDKKILITIDDAFLSFYENAWPFLKENQIPFILFTSTDFIGKKGYMNIDQLREVEKESFAYLGNHSHMHEYMVTFDFNKFTNDIDRSIEIFNDLFNYNPIFFSYPFGEYSLEQKNYISSKFEYAFGQHSGVIDLNKDPYELPRFPINEKYGDLKRFEFLIKLLPLQYSKIIPEDKLILNNNPPKMQIEFFKEQKNLSAINCFSDEGRSWNNTNIKLVENKREINFKEKFNFLPGEA